jgi:hypothetical protein
MREMPDREANNVEATGNIRAFRDLDAKPLPSFVLMTSPSEFP